MLLLLLLLLRRRRLLRLKVGKMCCLVLLQVQRMLRALAGDARPEAA